MYIDLLSSDNYITINKSLVNLMGLHGAVYCSVLINIYKKAIRKNKLINEFYCKVNRSYITELTTILPEEQLAIDKKMVDLGLMGKLEDNENCVAIDVDSLVCFIANDNTLKEKSVMDLLSEVKNHLAVKTKVEIDKAKQASIILKIKQCFTGSDLVKEAYKKWVDNIAYKYKCLKKVDATSFQDAINNYASNDVDKLAIIKLATDMYIKTGSIAIERFEKQKKRECLGNKRVSLASERITSMDQLSPEEF